MNVDKLNRLIKLADAVLATPDDDGHYSPEDWEAINAWDDENIGAGIVKELCERVKALEEYTKDLHTAGKIAQKPEHYACGRIAQDLSRILHGKQS